MPKKIDTFYRDSKGKVHYLHSTNSFRTCKAATESSKKMDYKPYQNKIGEAVNVERIFSKFDSLHRRWDDFRHII